MVKKYLLAALEALTGAVIIGAPIAYGVHRLWIWLWTQSAPPGATVMVLDTYGPFDGWFNLWLWAALLSFLMALPKTLVRTYKRRGRPEPGGVIASWGPDGDLKLLRAAEAWLNEHAERITAARWQADNPETGSEQIREIYPPCPRCGTPVKDYKAKQSGWVLMKFKPCGCRMILNRRLKRERNAVRP